MGTVVKLTLTHDDFATERATFETTRHGWPAILSSLKSLLETGKPLPFQAWVLGDPQKSRGDSKTARARDSNDWCLRIVFPKGGKKS